MLSCACTSSCRQWELETTHTGYTCYNSAVLYLPTSSENNLEMELVRSASGTRLYINVFVLAVPYADDPTKTPVQIEVEELMQTVYAERFEGGQRVLLPPDATAWILESLLNNQTVKIFVGRYHAEVIPTGFADLYKQFSCNP